ncbi:MAG: hypothetical protein ABI281_08905 [Caldimonas sp.]
MTPTEIDRVFGRSRLRMVTGDHVEVFREASVPGERRCYTKRFLATPDGDFREWTEREWRILARLVGHGLKPVPEIVQFDRGSVDRPALVQTYDAGITVDHWATLLPLERDGVMLKNVFEDCAHWWALARHALVALDAIHELRLVHLDLKADNVCIPVGPAGFDPRAGHERSLHPCFEDLTLIDFAFSLVSGERLKSALPIAAQPDYDYQSPRLLQALEQGRSGDLGMTRHLDWRCDFYSLAAMLWRYLPEPEQAVDRAWTTARHAKASAFVRHLIEVHDHELPAQRPHARMIALAAEVLAAPDLRLSLQRGWTLAYDATAPARIASTPITRIAPPRVAVEAVAAAASAAGELPRREERVSPVAAATLAATPVSPPTVATGDDASAAMSWPMHVEQSDIDARAAARSRQSGQRVSPWWWGAGLAAAAIASTPWLHAAWTASHDADRRAAVTTVAVVEPMRPPTATATVAKTSSTPAPLFPTASAPATAPAPATAIAASPAPAKTPATATSTMAPPQGDARSTVAPRVTPRTSTGAGSPRLVVRAEAPFVPPAAAAAPVRSARAAAADAAATERLARAEVNAAALSRARAGRGRAVPAPVPEPAPAPTAFPGRSADGPTPWAVAGRSPPVSSPVSMPVPMPTRAATAATQASMSIAVPPTSLPVPRSFAPQTRNVAADAASDDDRPDYGARADEIMAAYVPRVAQRAERAVSRTLFLAGRSDNVVGDGEVSGSAAQLGRSPGDVPSVVLALREAEGFHANARGEFARRGASREATQQQVRAFGANPIDPNGAGYLAFLLVRQRPAQAEAARQLALYALSMHGSRYPLGRAEDWTTLAIANALLGRQRDAQNAMLVSLAAAPNVERQCRAALDLVGVYGDRMRAPVEALLRGAQAASPRPSSLCEWPPYWGETTSTR